MIQKLNISGFKSFDTTSLSFKNLNLFSGANSVGKSSAIQALLFAIDNIHNTKGTSKTKYIHTQPFTFNEIRNYIINAKTISIELLNENEKVELSFTAEDDAFLKTEVRQTSDSDVFYKFSDKILYLPAFRSANLNKSSINPNPINPLGLNGEYLIDFYQNHHNDLITDDLKFYKSSNTLESQVNYWLNKLTGYKIIVEQDNTEYKVKFETNNQKKLLPYHVGTGISYIAELIISALGMDPNGLLIIENPEIHLHPSAQADVIDFLALISNTGRQIILESHSDHIFNGIRRLLHEGKLAIEDTNIYNFTRNELGITDANQIALTQYGGIVNYTPGMFEQFDKDLDAILR